MAWRLTSEERAFLHKFAARLDLDGTIETENDLEAALLRSLGFDQFTDEWAIEWFADLRREQRSEPLARVVQDNTRAARPGLPSMQKARPSRR